MAEWLRNYRTLMGFGFRSAPRQATLFLLSGVLMSLVYPVAAYGFKLLVDAAVGEDGQKAVIAVIALSAIAGLGLVNGLVYVDLLFTVAERASGDVDRKLIRLMGGVPGIEHHDLPEHIDRLDLLREQRSMLGWMTNATAGLLRVAVQLLASGVLLARLHPALLLLPLFSTVSFLAGRRAQELQRHAEEATAEAERLRRHLFETATDAASGKEVRVFGLLPNLLERHHAASDTVMRERNGADWRSAGLQTAGALVFGAAYAGAVGLVLLLAVRGTATPGDVVLAVGLASGMNTIMSTAVFYGTNFLRILRVGGRYLWLERYAADAQPAPVDPVPASGRLDRGIALEDVSFRYAGMDTDVLSGVRLWLPAGSVVAIVGENGAGKTTLVKLLCELYEPTAGRILIDGIDVRRMAGEGWRERISAAFQDFVRFEFLARETVGIGDLPRIASTGEVGAARRAANDAGTVTVLVSHRFSTVRMADLIAVLDGGRIREVGDHEALMAHGGLYAELYELQARAYR